MRLTNQNREIIRNAFAEFFSDGEIFLFGSRTDDSKRGGDIDLLILSDYKRDFKIISNFRIALLRRLGDRKIDILNYAYGDESPFLNLIKLNAEKI